MKILFHALKPEGGMTSYRVHIFEVLNGLTKLGHKIIFTNGQPYSVVSNSDSMSITLSGSGKESIWERIKSRVKTLPLRYEIDFAWRLISEVKLFLLGFVNILRYKPDVIYWRNDMSNSGKILAGLFKIPSIVEVNGIIFDEAKISKNNDKLTFFLIDKMEKFSLWKSDRYIAVTQYLKASLSNDYKVPAEKIVVIENGADTELFKPLDTTSTKNQLGLTPCVNYICYVGELQPWQGVEYFVQAMPEITYQLPNAKAIIVGDGVCFEELNKLARQLNILNKIIFTGRVRYEQVPLYINASDICLVLGKKQRNQKIGASPLKLGEYLSCGKPVLASFERGAEILKEYSCGFSVNPEDPEDLARASIKLLRDPEMRMQMGNNGRKYMIENRSWSKAAKKIEDVCQEAIQEKQEKKHQR